MKITIEKPEDTKKEITYPCLMKAMDQDLIVLFTEADVGIALTSVDRVKLGYYSKDWHMEHFQPLPSGTKVILEVE